MNKSESVRQLLNEQPNIKPAEAVTVLKDRGVSVTPGFFSTIKSKKQGRRGRRRVKSVSAPGTKSAAPAAPAAAKGPEPTIQHLLAAKRYIGEVGDIRRAKEAVAVLERLL